jgi:FMN-dependent NADH-azoreductase
MCRIKIHLARCFLAVKLTPMKTLIIKYLPSGARSHTKKLLTKFTEAIGNSPTETVDLLAETMPMFSEASLAAYMKRNYMKQPLSSEESALLSVQDRLVKQFKAADVVVMAYPMHNFGMPGVVKSYFDAVMLKEETFEMGKKVLAGKKALTLYAAGGIYSADHWTLEYPHWDGLTHNAKINFSFMGFDEAEVIGTSLRDSATEAERLRAADEKISALVKKWYN